MDITTAANNFFYAFDNFTMFQMNIPPEQEGQAAAMREAYTAVFNYFGSEPGVYAGFRRSYNADPSLGQYHNLMRQFAEQLALVQKDTFMLLEQYLGEAEMHLDQAVQESFELFGQGTLFDPRRDNEAYGYWSIHSMDSRYPQSPPIGYYGWYTFIRANTVVNGETNPNDLHLARCVTVASAVQNTMKPEGASGPTKTNPNNPPIPQAELANIRSTYMDLGFAALDELWATADADSPLGPPPSLGGRTVV